MSFSFPTPPIFPIEKQLKGFADWWSFKNQVVIALRARGLNGYIDNSIRRPAISTIPPTKPTLPTSPNPSVEEWEMRDNVASATIYQNILLPSSQGLKPDWTSERMWALLCSKFDHTTELLKGQAEDRLRDTKYKDGTPLNLHLEALEALRTEANESGCTIDDTRLISITLRSLTFAYATSVQMLQNESNLTKVNNDLLEIYRFMTDNQPQVTDVVDSTSLAAIRNIPRCSICKRRGHDVPDCFARGGGKEGKGPASYRAPKGLEPRTATVINAAHTLTCSCGASSSSAPVAQEPVEVYAYSVTNLSDDYDNNGMPNTEAVDDVADLPLARRLQPEVAVLEREVSDVVAVGCSVVVCTTSSTSSQSKGCFTYLDSGATHHCVKERHRFVKYTESSKSHSSSLADGAAFKVAGCGTARFDVKTRDGKVNRVLLDALHTPSFDMNLLSIPALDTKGLRGSWGGGLFTVVDPKSGQIVIDGAVVETRTRRLYQVDVVDGRDGGTVVVAGVESHVRPAALDRWHQRLGHADVRMILRMADKGLVDGLDITDRKIEGMCEDCIYGKIVRRPFNIKVVPELTPLERVALDLWGMARTRSRGGAVYMMLVSDAPYALALINYASLTRGHRHTLYGLA